MLSDLHVHSIFCDGKNTPEEIIIKAIEKGFVSIGFSSHGYTDFDLRYCMKNAEAYIKEINRLKEVYRHEIQIYLGIEEDAFAPINRQQYDYVIGSSHYYCVAGQYYPIDSSYEYFSKCLELFQCDVIRMAHTYYKPFCHYILESKPDIVGHFDLITKFDESHDAIFLENRDYVRIAEEYMAIAATSGCLFEVNTGAIARGIRKTQYPYEHLLQVLRKNGSGLVLSSDCHDTENLSFGFSDMRNYLKDLGFQHLYVLYNGEFVKDVI